MVRDGRGEYKKSKVRHRWRMKIDNVQIIQKKWMNWRWLLFGLFFFVVSVSLLFCNFLIQYAMVRDGKPVTTAAAETQTGERITIESGDGLTLVGTYLAAEKRQHKWVILVHGYHSSKELMLAAMGERYQQQGYHVLAIDQRAHGESEGKYIGMGWLERKDLLQWIQWVTERDGKARIALHGISMGGATVMMAAGEADLSDQVKVVVEDCGYTSAWDIFSYQLQSQFHLPPVPVLSVCEPIAQLRTGVRLHQASALEQVKKAKLPILFIHGTADTFVPVAMVDSLYEAASGKKEKLLVEGGTHALSRQADPDLYYGTVFRFLQEHI